MGACDIMMKMADMKMSKKSAKETMAGGSPVSEGEEYPYGLRITLDEDQVKKIPNVMDYNPDTVVHIMAIGKVIKSESIDTSGGKSRRSVSIQITELGCERKKKHEEMTDEEYGKEKKHKRMLGY